MPSGYFFEHRQGVAAHRVAVEALVENDFFPQRQTFTPGGVMHDVEERFVFSIACCIHPVGIIKRSAHTEDRRRRFEVLMRVRVLPSR